MDVVANLALNDNFRLKILIKIFTSVKKNTRWLLAKSSVCKLTNRVQHWLHPSFTYSQWLHFISIGIF